VIKEVADENVIETLVGVFDFVVVNGFDGVRGLVDGNATGVFEDMPFLFGVVIEHA
jgi:hypothetical protein